MRKKISFCCAVFLFLTTALTAQSLRLSNLIPAPQKVELNNDKFVKPGKLAVKINTRLDLPSDECYTLKITPKEVKIVAKTEQGVIWAKQTLRQLTTADGYVPLVYIEDYPAFNIRGYMNDTGRNFTEIDILKRHIDMISYYKMNVFHWHLTDNPAWRVECKVYPQLNDAKYQQKGRDEGKFYTYDEIRDVIKYASERGVMVIPEIDMPGHSKFFNTTFGFAMASPEGMAVLEKCLDEFFKEIPKELCPYFHIGSDEVHIKNPKEFMRWAENMAKKYDRMAVAWDPGLPADTTTIRQIWNVASAANAAASDKPGRYLDSSMGYLNYDNPMVYVDNVFLHNPCSSSYGNDKALGGILCLWNDVRAADKSKIEIHNGLMAGILPFSERFWKGGNVGHKNSSHVLPAPNTEQGIALDSFQKKMSFHRDSIIDNAEMHWVATSNMEWDITIPQMRGTDTTDMQWIKAWGGAIEMDELCLDKKLKQYPTMDAWAVTYIDSDEDKTITAWVGFEATARSNRISNGIGYQGKWENDGRLKVNNIEIDPAEKWNEPGAYKYHSHTWGLPPGELPFTDEQFFWTRTPVTIQLKKGRNKIEMYVPRVFPRQRWTFAFMPIDTSNGKYQEVKGITYVNQ